MAAEFSVGSAADVAAKLPENGVSDSHPDSVSSVIPGWFSEISPMWPGEFFSSLILYFHCLAVV